jgi:hypothetical protein
MVPLAAELGPLPGKPPDRLEAIQASVTASALAAQNTSFPADRVLTRTTVWQASGTCGAVASNTSTRSGAFALCTADTAPKAVAANRAARVARRKAALS